MKNSKLRTVAGFALLSWSLNMASQTQTLVNLLSVTPDGVSDTARYAPIFINSDGNVVVAGNQMVNAQQYDATTAALAANGAIVWQQATSTGGNAFTTASTHD